MGQVNTHSPSISADGGVDRQADYWEKDTVHIGRGEGRKVSILEKTTSTTTGTLLDETVLSGIFFPTGNAGPVHPANAVR